MQKNNVYIFSQGYHNKLSQLQWLKIKEIYYFTVREAAALNHILGEVGSFGGY